MIQPGKISGFLPDSKEGTGYPGYGLQVKKKAGDRT